MAKKAQDDWMRDYETRREKERQAALTDLAKARKRLMRLGVQTVTIEYDGQGDSGCIEGITFDPEPKRLTQKLADRIEEAAYQLLPDGWENNEGAYGIFRIDVKTGKLLREHSWRIESVESEDIEYDLKTGGQRPSHTRITTP